MPKSFADPHIDVPVIATLNKSPFISSHVKLASPLMYLSAVFPNSYEPIIRFPADPVLWNAVTSLHDFPVFANTPNASPAPGNADTRLEAAL